MLHAQAQSPLTQDESEFDTRVKLLRKVAITALGVFAGAVMGGVCGLFVYANSRTPNVHDGVYIVIQSIGLVLGLAMGFLAARNIDAQDEFIEASQKAGTTLLRRYKPKPGAAGLSNVGQRTIGAANNAGEEFLRTLLASNHK
jgi:hypothetical protein